MSYVEGGNTVVVSCSDETNGELYKIIQPFNTTNSLTFGGYTGPLGNYATTDPQHTTGPDLELIDYYGVWFQFDFGSSPI